MAISTTYDSLVELARIGLIVRRYGRVELAALSLDDIAQRHALNEVWEERLTAHRTARMHWRHWLQTRQQPPMPPPPTMTEPDPGTYLHYSGDADDVDHYLSIVLATGPPVADPIPKEPIWGMRTRGMHAECRAVVLTCRTGVLNRAVRVQNTTGAIKAPVVQDDSSRSY